MTQFDKEMQRALTLDAQKLRDEGVDCPDPIFLDENGDEIDPYPQWEQVSCGCCAGLEWGGEEPRECRNCGGNGTLSRHKLSGVLALYPGGPLRGKDFDYLKRTFQFVRHPVESMKT